MSMCVSEETPQMLAHHMFVHIVLCHLARPLGTSFPQLQSKLLFLLRIFLSETQATPQPSSDTPHWEVMHFLKSIHQFLRNASRNTRLACKMYIPQLLSLATDEHLSAQS